jgi:predicted metal-dependent hydrolase
VGDAVTKTAPVEIVRRRVGIDFDPVPPGPWYPRADQALETVLNAMSLTFPAGERYFIDSVRAYSDRISDPELRKQVRDFIYQEAMHNKVHVDCNAMLARHNPRSALIEKGAHVVFRVLRYLPRAFRLSISSAVEHFSSMAADTLFHHAKAFQQNVPPEVSQMWLWHAAEETEHKAVCIDVLRHVSGRFGYFNRIAGMLLATPLFLIGVLFASIVLRRPRSTAAPVKAHQAATPKPSDGPFGGGNMAGVMHAVIPWKLYFAYYRPSFHPWDYDNCAYVAAWKQRNPSFGLQPQAEPAGLP